MKYQIEFHKKALKDLKKIPTVSQKRILNGIRRLGDDLSGDIKKLSVVTPSYRLRVGSYRILFEVEDNVITIWHVLHRKDSY